MEAWAEESSYLAYSVTSKCSFSHERPGSGGMKVLLLRAWEMNGRQKGKKWEMIGEKDSEQRGPGWGEDAERITTIREKRDPG